MTKREIGKAVARQLMVADGDGLAAVRATLDVIGKALARGDRIELRGFGVFEPREQAARMGMNIRTGERIAIPARRAIKFKASDAIGSRGA